MKQRSVGKLTGFAGMTLGLCSCAVWWSLLLLPSRDEKDVSSYAFVIVMAAILTLPSMLAAYFGYRLVRNVTEENIKWGLGTLTAMLAFWLWYEIDAFVKSVVHEYVANTPSLLLATLTVIPLYVFVCAAVLKREGIPVGRYRSLIGKPAIFLVALQIWSLGIDIHRAYGYREGEVTFISPFLGLFGPIIAAWVFYKVAMKVVGRNGDNQNAPADAS